MAIDTWTMNWSSAGNQPTLARSFANSLPYRAPVPTTGQLWPRIQQS